MLGEKVTDSFKSGRVMKVLVRTDSYGGVTVRQLDGRGYLIPKP